jgi:hypothetical protein
MLIKYKTRIKDPITIDLTKSFHCRAINWVCVHPKGASLSDSNGRSIEWFEHLCIGQFMLGDFFATSTNATSTLNSLSRREGGFIFQQVGTRLVLLTRLAVALSNGERETDRFSSGQQLSSYIGGFSLYFDSSRKSEQHLNSCLVASSS